MNYRHAFHAGNFADVFKHILLTRIIAYLVKKDAPLRYIDTHAGAGSYDLRAEEAARGGEWREGVARLAGANWSQEARVLVAPYLAALGPLAADGAPNIYPGSPALAQKLLRRADRIILCERSPDAFAALAAAVRRDRRAKAIEIDGWTALNAYVPPKERRGLALIDPPFEEPDEFERARAALRAAYRKWPTGIYALWYPIKDRCAVEAFYRRAMSDEFENALAIELTVGEARADAPLAACGLVVVNPPYVLEREARILLPELTRALSRGPGATWRMHALSRVAAPPM